MAKLLVKLALVAALLVIAAPTSVRADYISATLGLAGPDYYAVLALTGAKDIALNGPGTTMGNVGISSGTLALNGSNGPEVKGNVYLASGASVSIGSPPQVSGSVIANQNLSKANQDALAAAAAFNALSPTKSVSGGAINQSLTITGTSGVNVIDVSGINLNKATLTLNGPAGAQFIINDSGSLVLNSGNVVLTGGVSNSDVVLNVTSSGNSISSSGGLNQESIINGILLAPESGVAFAPGEVNGELIAGGSTIHLVSGASVVVQPNIIIVPPSTSVPTPPAAVMALLGGCIIPAFLSRLGRRSAKLPVPSIQ